MQYDPDLIIEPRRGRAEKNLPGRALLVANPAEAEQAVRLFSVHQGSSRALYQTEIMVDEKARLCLAGPALGAAAAALVIEKLIVLGVREIWLVSCCGTIDPGLSIGDLLIGERAVSGEGVSSYYAEENVMQPSGQVVDQFYAFARQYDFGVRQGTIWSTDAPYRERRSELIGLRERYGVCGVDMEFSALCAVAQFRKVSFGGLFVVSDELWRKNWKPGFSQATFTQRCQSVIGNLIDFGLHREAMS